MGTLQPEDFKFSIVHDETGQVPLTEHGEKHKRRMVVHWNSERVLAPGEVLENRHTVSRYWDMNRPGKYRITASRIASRENWQELKAQGVPLEKRLFEVVSNTVEIDLEKE